MTAEQVDSVPVNLRIVSSDPVTHAGLAAIADRDKTIQLVEEAAELAGGSDAVPDVVLLNEPTSQAELLEIVQDVARCHANTCTTPEVIVVTRRECDDMIVTALRVGVRGYLTRVSSPHELTHAIRLVASGGAAFSQCVADRVGLLLDTRQPPSAASIPGLTEREQEILGLLADGLSNRQISQRLFLAEKTVRNYVSRILAKLNAVDRTAAALIARDAGLSNATATVNAATG